MCIIVNCVLCELVEEGFLECKCKVGICVLNVLFCKVQFIILQVSDEIVEVGKIYCYFFVNCVFIDMLSWFLVKFVIEVIQQVFYIECMYFVDNVLF